MPINPYFNRYDFFPEQSLIDDVMVEIIKMNGMEAYYIARNIDGETEDLYDYLYGENPISRFKHAYPIEVYINETTSFSGDKEFFSKFGLEIRDETSMIISRRTFKRAVGGVLSNPREGDLLYVVPLLMFFEIKFIEDETHFYTMGHANKNREPFVYTMNCELLRFSQEKFDTGVTNIDNQEKDYSFAVDMIVATGSGNYSLDETVFQGGSLSLANVTAKVSNWDSPSNTLTLYNIKGEFANNIAIVGANTGTSRVLTSFDMLTTHSPSGMSISDNKNLENSGNTYVNFTETNPFGDP